MTEKLDDVWTDRDFPVLVEVTRRIDGGEQFFRPAVVAESLSMRLDVVKLSLAALGRRGLVQQTLGLGGGGHIDGVSTEAYFLTGLHPSGDDAVSTLVDALRQAADLTPDPQEKSRLRTLADTALGVSRDVLGGVLVNLTTKGMLS